jgi:hypothetical protein
MFYRDAGMTKHAAMIDQWFTDVNEKLCGCEASKCDRKVPPSQISSGGKCVFCTEGEEKSVWVEIFWL